MKEINQTTQELHENTHGVSKEKVLGVKGMDQNMKCRGYQYEVGKSYEETEAKACKKGFHFCENPMDVFDYYPPGVSRYFEVEGNGEIDRDTSDSKIACSKLHIKSEIGITGLIQLGVKFMLDRVNWKDAKESNTGDQSAATNTGDQSAATNTGYRSAATNTGYQSAATNTGYQSAATNTGDQSAATNTGDQSAANVEGKESVAISTGYESKAKGALGCWIVLAEWKEKEGKYHIADVQSAHIDGINIKANTWYMLQDGKFTELLEESK